MLVPTSSTLSVSMRTRNGPVIANSASGMRNRNIAASSELQASGSDISLRQTGFTAGTVAHK